MATRAKPQQKANDLPWLIGLGVLAVIGIAAWVVQLTQGFATLGLGQAVAWGAYIGAFFLLAGTGSGLVVLAALADLNVIPSLKPQRRVLLIGAIASFVAAGFAILMDIGKPERVFNLLFSPNLSSMFVWDFWALALSIVLAVAYLVVGPKSKPLLVAAALIAAAVVVVEGFILAVTAGRPLWHSAILPVVFLVEAGITASAVVLLLGGDDKAATLRRALAVLLPVALLLSLLELVTVGYGGNPDARAAMNLLTGGALAPLYWGQILLGIVLPFVLLVWAANNRSAVMAAAVLAFIGVFAAKFVLLVAGQALPFMGAPATYMPTLIELAGLVGMLGLAAFLFVLGKRYLPARYGQ
jgi:molybdopterin-containing oxidoreductase family membrane subunit